MFAIRKMIDSGLRWLFAVCILPLCLTVAVLGIAASPANPAARADLPLPLISSSKAVDPPDILFPKPPPPPPLQAPPPSDQGTTAMEQMA